MVGIKQSLPVEWIEHFMREQEEELSTMGVGSRYKSMTLDCKLKKYI